MPRLPSLHAAAAAFTDDVVVVQLGADTKVGALRACVANLLSDRHVPDEVIEQTVYLLLQRECFGWGMLGSVAIPHATMNIPRAYVGWFLFSRPTAELRDLDICPARIIVCVLAPDDGAHIDRLQRIGVIVDLLARRDCLDSWADSATEADARRTIAELAGENGHESVHRQ